MKKNIKYIDCDGVILDTETGLFDEYNKLKQQNPTLKRLVYLQQLNWQYWIRQAKIIGNAIEILKQQNPDDVAILTKVHSLAEGLAKIEYFRELGVKNNVILVPNDIKKSSVVQATGNLLLDDSIKNLDDWASYGGIPMFFNQFGENKETFKEQTTTNEFYPLITSLETFFSKETDDYCKIMRLKR